MSVDFGVLKAIFKFLDHKMMVSKHDETFLDAKLFDPEGVVVLPGKNPSVENLALYCMGKALEALGNVLPARQLEYHIKLEIQETDNNFFTLERNVVI